MYSTARALEYGEVVSLPVNLEINSDLTLYKNTPLIVTNVDSNTFTMDPIDGDSILKLSQIKHPEQLKVVAMLNKDNNTLEYSLTGLSN